MTEEKNQGRITKGKFNRNIKLPRHGRGLVQQVIGTDVKSAGAVRKGAGSLTLDAIRRS